MATIRYSRPKLVLAMLASAGLAWFGSYAVEYGGGGWKVAGVAFIVFAALAIPFALRYIVSPKVLSIDARGLTHHAAFGTRRADWRDLEGVSVEASTSTAFNFAKLQVRGPFGLFRRCEVFELVLGGEYRSIGSVLAAMQAAQNGPAENRRRAANEQAPSGGSPHR